MYLAHISEDKERGQSIMEHLEGTAERAGNFAAAFGCRDWGYGCAVMHDIGKYSESFQKRLHGGALTDHATAGARELYKRKNIIAAYCAAGHHSGLPDGGTPADSGGAPTLLGRMKKDLDDYCKYQEEIKIPAFSRPPMRQLGKGGFSLSFFIRILFSCLVDADFLDTEYFMLNGHVDRGTFDSMEVLYQKLRKYVEPWLENKDEAAVNGRRSAILKACLEQGKGAKGMYQLTVPTGGGKTVSSLAFALEHAVRHEMKRIIYVIPYTNIIEQNAGVFRDILGEGNVLEDHSNLVFENENELDYRRLAAENWDVPVVVTTNVQFFESLFSNKASKCRKLHNIADSVLIFDEAQMLPVKYLKPCILAISELVYNYRCTAVLCTATQPYLQEFIPKEIKVRELCPDVEGQFQFFKRALVENLGELAEEEFIEALQEKEQVLCILNSRKRVQRVYEALKGEGTYHLSTFMYPKHRKRVLKEIRERLKEGKICRLVATSLVEAGVDFDFGTVYRELAGIDSIIQAAGRCNREGSRALEDSRTFIFTFESSEDIHIPNQMRLPIAVANQIAKGYEDLTALEAIEEYFKRLFHYKGEGVDEKDIVGQMEQSAGSKLFPFAAVASQFQLIENDTVSVLVDVENEAEEIAEKLAAGEYSRKLMRRAGQYCVNIYENDYKNLYGAGRLKEMGNGLYLLRNREQYQEDRGLIMDAERGDALIF